MQYTLEALLKGQEKILEYYEHAKTHWDELFADAQAADSWAAWIAREEKAYFEPECGGMFVGREVMAWSAFASLYSIQFGWQDDKLVLARKLIDGFAESTCSEETKAAAVEAERLYDVESTDAT